MKSKWLLIIALLLIIGGGLLAYFIQTDGNTVTIKDIRFVGSDGKLNSALLYIPPDVSTKNPAPGIVATHGYINSRETQTGFAIEFARRGYVVLAPDESGHGFSDPPAFRNGFGGIDTLKYLRTLDFVDPNNIGLEGHSMGGWASVAAAGANPDGYKSMALVDSSTGTFGVPQGTATFPRNMALIFAKYSEFSKLMWGAAISADRVKTDKLKNAFGTTENVEDGKLYGSIEGGTARKLYPQVKTIHPGVTHTTEGIDDAIDWMQLTLKGGKNIPLTNQIWYWKEIGTFIAMIGMILLIFPVGQLLLQTNFFKTLSDATPETKSLKGFGWWVGAIITILLPIPVYLWAWSFNGKGIAAKSRLLPQDITTTIMFWALTVGLISLILFLLWHFLSNRKKGASFVNYGFTWKDKGMDFVKIGKSFLLAAVICFAAYLTLAISAWAFTTDYRIWVFAIKPMTFLHFRIFLSYLIPFMVYFLILGLCLHGELRCGEKTAWKEMVVSVILMITGYIILLLLMYIPLLSGGTLCIPDAHLPTIVMFQFLPVFTIVAMVSTYFYRKTGHIYTGAFLNALLITWILVAGTATHFAL
jgi:pimeloyl-ACP methyl ester carboxylesterase